MSRWSTTLLLALFCLVSACSLEKNELPKPSGVIVNGGNTDLMVGLRNLEVHVPGVYVTSSSTSVGDCEEKKSNTCMIIRATFRPIDPEGDPYDQEIESAMVFLPDEFGDFGNTEGIPVTIRSFSSEATELTLEDEFEGDVFVNTSGDDFDVIGIYDDIWGTMLVNLNMTFIIE